MKVIVFGSTGTIGKHLIEQSLEKGHEVLAFCRDASKLSEFKHPNLSTTEGDVVNPIDVQNAVKGQDVVIIALGSGKSRKSTVRSEGTKNIIAAMKDCGVSRLICQSTLGTGESNNNLNFFWKHIMFGWYLKQVFLDHELQEDYVKNSNLDWTIVRPGAFTDGKKTEDYLHGFSPNDRSVKLKISRADVADFILKQVGNKSYMHQTPGLSY
ncbi:NAD(P)-dependent oxidoreductase [Aquimarina sp. 2304DJ70-9]|uniref:NAD(P)-dependent oxidoreductase n=1 Tax=Aquimarina penaris TaxID=3231044 RepID=UPI0034622369